MKYIAILIFITSLHLLAKDYAVIVGVSKYKETTTEEDNLQGATRDAIAFKNLLEESKFSGDIKILLNEKATKDSIKNALKQVANSAKKSRNDRFYFFYSGHGARDDNSNSGILIPYDINRSNPNSYILAKRDFLPYFKKIDKNVKFGLIAIDSCYSGNMYKGFRNLTQNNRFKSKYYAESLKVNKNESLTKIESDYKYKNLIFLSAADEYHEAYEDKVLKRGVFSLALESCFFKYKTTTISSLQHCLDNRYIKNMYKILNNNLDSNTLIFELKKEPKIDKIVIKSDNNYKELQPLVKFSDAEIFDFELKKDGKKFLLTSMPNGLIINRFNTIDRVANYISKYRIIAQKGRFGSDLEINIRSSKIDKKVITIPTNSKINIEVYNTKNIASGYLTLFSLGQNGNLYIITSGIDFAKNRKYNIAANTDSKKGINFLKAVVFDNLINFNGIKQNIKGEVIGGDEEKILKILNSKTFYDYIEVVKTY